MKKFIILLVAASLFGDTIKYRPSLLFVDTKQNVEYIGIQNENVLYKTKEGNIESISCKLVKEILDTSNNTIPFDCNSNTYYGSTLNLKIKESRQYIFKPSGGAIAIGTTVVIFYIILKVLPK